MGPACRYPWEGPAVRLETGQTLLGFAENGSTYSIGDVPPFAVGARVPIYTLEGDDGGPVTLASLSPELVRVEGPVLVALAEGEATIQVDSPCPSLDAPCSGTFTIRFALPDRASFYQEWMLFHGASTTARVELYADFELLSGDRVVTASSGATVDPDTGELSITAPESGTELLIDVVTQSGVAFTLSRPLAGLTDIDGLRMNCQPDMCMAEALSGGERVFGAPVEWSYEGMPVVSIGARTGSRYVFDGELDPAGCAVCGRVVGTPYEECRQLTCAPGEVVP